MLKKRKDWLEVLSILIVAIIVKLFLLDKELFGNITNDLFFYGMFICFFGFIFHRKNQDKQVLDELKKSIDFLNSQELSNSRENYNRINDEFFNNKNNLQSEDIINHLLIPDEYLQIADIKVKSIRISEDVEKKFNEFCDKFKQYSKTSMLNYALIEFMEKYKG